MFRSILTFLSQLFLDPIRTFFHTFRVLSRMRKESKAIAFSEEEIVQINDRIRSKALETLLERIDTFGVEVIKRNTDWKIKQSLNETVWEKASNVEDEKVKETIRKLMESYLDAMDIGSINLKTKRSMNQHLNEELNKFSCKPGNPELKTRKEELFSDYLASLTTSVIDHKNRDKIQELINQRGIKWVHDDANKVVQSQVDMLFKEFLEGLNQSNISHSTQNSIVEQVNSAVETIACREGNPELDEKSRELAHKTLKSLDKSNVTSETMTSIQKHVNKKLLDQSTDANNEEINVQVAALLSEVVEKFDASILSDPTITELKANLNDRAIELAKLSENQTMIKKAEELLDLYLSDCKVIDTVNQESMSAIKQSLNTVILDLLSTSDQVGEEAKRRFNDILGRVNTDNMDPIIKMKTEAALYKVIVKELAVYGNEEMIKKAVEFMHDLSQRLPHESSTNDMIMNHKIRQIQYLK